MRESKAMIDALKSILRSQKITYADVAQHLGVSEATVKRIFADYNFSLERLEAICALAKVRIADLADAADDKPVGLTRLTEEQERRLATDPKLLLTAMLTLNHWSIEDIMETYDVDENALVGKLLQLDKLGMIELLPGNRIRHLTAKHFAWRPNGPVQAYFEAKLKGDFLNSRFDQPGEHMRFLGGMISRDNILRMHQSIDKLVEEMGAYILQDADLPTSEKWGVGAVFALRPWEVPDFRALRIKEGEPFHL